MARRQRLEHALDRVLPRRVRERCAICGGAAPAPLDGEGRDDGPLPVCPSHTSAARLESGALLAELVPAADALGASAVFFLGPARVDGVRVWPEASGGAVGLRGERFSSRDAFEFVVQHDPGGTAVLRRLRDADPASLKSLPALVERLGSDWPAFEALAATWSLARRVEGPFELVAHVDELVALAKRRLPAAWLRDALLYY